MFNTQSTDGWEPERWTAVSLYLDELPIQKCKFRGRFKVSILCLDKHSPKGSCHLDESSMNHTLAQKHLCEFWCGMHRTCKNTSIKPDRSGWMTRSEKLCEGNLSTSLLDQSNHSDAAHSSSVQIGNSDCENRTGIEVASNGNWKFGWKTVRKTTSRGNCSIWTKSWSSYRHGGFWVSRLATSHCRKLTWKMKFEAGTSKGRLPLISLWLLAVFVGTGTRVTPAPPAGN